MVEISLNLGYVKTLPGIIRMVEVILDFLLCFVAGIYCNRDQCWSVVPDSDGVHWCLFVYATGFLLFAAFFLIHILNVDRHMGRLLPLIELIVCAVFVVFHITAFGTMAKYAHDYAYDADQLDRFLLPGYSNFFRRWEGQAVTACLFSLIAAVIIAVDAVFALRNRSSS